MKGRAVRLAAGCLLMIAATGTFLFPRICDQISRIRLLTEAYEAIVQDECENYEEAVRYNEKIARLQAEKAFLPMLVTPSGMVMLVRLLQPEKAYSPMLVTLLGIVMLVRLLQP